MREAMQTVLIIVVCVMGAVASAQPAAPATPHKAIQEAPGEGDSGESDSIDEATDAKPHAGPYESPYRLTFQAPLKELLFDGGQPRGSVAAQSSVPVHEWYGAEVRHEWGSWGVPARVFDCPPGVAAKPVEWRRERVVAAAARFIGYAYQHHHVPDWDPPSGWPWQHCCAGRNGKGVDCSNFSGWNYNWALGIHLNTDIHKQAAQAKARSTGGELHARVIARPEGKPAEWCGIKDSNGHAIPCGIHLRPFHKGSWYHMSFDHAHRWVK